MFKMLIRRQTAEEREQERQAATKYFLSMQLGSMNSPPRNSSASDAKNNDDVSSNVVSRQTSNRLRLGRFEK